MAAFYIGGIAGSEVLVQAVALYALYISVHRLAAGKPWFPDGIISLIFLVISSTLLFSIISSFLLLFHGQPFHPVSDWSLPLFLFCMVCGEIIRKMGAHGEGLKITALSAFALVAAAASFLIGGQFVIAPPAAALILTFLLFLGSGRFAYRLTLALIEKIS
jgi:hypothetical protein